ncbi:uncharacterized protein B0H64DRAFT_37567 [Chaetomium fimeti]|uniref:Secreted protein n=1 Tax=Chaetomium fimeti TaxID=1854472 RepID=A0AAE0HRJ2_9PEZI|nr:hypothetical protein B0H64DRAFT_37567 [Chaetomium fimeti]
MPAISLTPFQCLIAMIAFTSAFPLVVVSCSSYRRCLLCLPLLRHSSVRLTWAIHTPISMGDRRGNKKTLAQGLSFYRAPATFNILVFRSSDFSI